MILGKFDSQRPAIKCLQPLPRTWWASAAENGNGMCLAGVCCLVLSKHPLVKTRLDLPLEACTFLFMVCCFLLQKAPLLKPPFLGSRKRHTNTNFSARFNPVALGVTPGLSQGQTQFIPRTTTFFFTIFLRLHIGSPMCSWDKPWSKGGNKGLC